MSGKFDKFLGKIREKDSVTVNLVEPNAEGNINLTASNIPTAEGLNLEEALVLTMPAGTVIAFAGSAAPEGFIACNGALIDRTTYADLFAAIGTIYGEGDGSTTFALPDLTDRFIQGSSTAGTSKDAGLPNITGLGMYLGDSYVGGAFYTRKDPGLAKVNIYSDSWYGVAFGFDASRSNSIYGGSTTVQPPALTMLYCIKY